MSCDDWQKDALACVALCIVLDQFPRNMFREAPRSFATDAKALTVARQAVDNGLDRAATVEDKHRHFLYTPFMHSEALEEQRMCLVLVSERMDNPDVVAYAERQFGNHRAVWPVSASQRHPGTRRHGGGSRISARQKLAFLGA